jgi:hypothetical protein
MGGKKELNILLKPLTKDCIDPYVCIVIPHSSCGGYVQVKESTTVQPTACCKIHRVFAPRASRLQGLRVVETACVRERSTVTHYSDGAIDTVRRKSVLDSKPDGM